MNLDIRALLGVIDATIMANYKDLAVLRKSRYQYIKKIAKDDDDQDLIDIYNAKELAILKNFLMALCHYLDVLMKYEKSYAADSKMDELADMILDVRNEIKQNIADQKRRAKEVAKAIAKAAEIAKIQENYNILLNVTFGLNNREEGR